MFPDSTRVAPVATSAHPQTDSRPRLRRVLGPVKTAAIVAGAVLALHLRNPHSDGSWGKCPSLILFGVACPLCGGLRAVNDLSNGHVAQAFWSNALFVSVIPLIAVWWLSVVRDRWRGSTRPWTWPIDYPPVIPIILSLLFLFAVVRNTPWGSALYP